MPWTCPGIKDGDRVHDECQVEGKFCPHCGQTQEDVKPPPGPPIPPILPKAIAGVVAITLLGGVGYFAWSQLRPCPGGQQKIDGNCSGTTIIPTSTPTNSNSNPNAKSTQKNTRYGISLEYPQSLELREGKDYPPSALTGTKDLFQLLLPDRGGASYRANILVKIEQVADPPFLDEYVNEQVARITQLGTFQVESQQDIKLGQQSAREIIYSGNNGEYNLKRKRIIAAPKTKDDYFLLITYTADINDYDQYLPEVEQVFNSITLLD
ncbi:MAG: DUF1795 domain-containing protein [Symploca sp. SIO2E6]|nr:DUF1795 domain-containing protein [Symploca sp. SIO2E6]